MHQPPEESVKEFEEQPKTIVISALEGEFQPPQETSVEILQAKDDLMKSIKTFLKKFNRISFRETPKILLLAWEKFFEIQHAKPEDIQDLLHKLLEDLKIISEELAEFINSPSWNRPTFYDVDDDEYTIIYRSSKAITPDLSIEEPDNSLSMGDEHLSTISEMESDKVIKSSVENLVLIPRESEGVSDDTCDVPFCVNSPLLDVLNDHFEIFSDSNNDCTSSDNDSFEDIDYIEASPPEDFLIMRNEELSTIPEKESDEFIKSKLYLTKIRLRKHKVHGHSLVIPLLTEGRLEGRLTKDTVLPTNNGSTKDVQPPVIQVQSQVLNSEPAVAPGGAPMPNPKPSIPYPSRLNDERRREKANNQIEKFYEIFKDLSFEISLTDALILMLKFASTLKALIRNKEKLSEMARTPLNEHCSAVILNKLPEKLGDPGKFLIPCDFPGMDECLTLADLGASINLMPLSVWKKLSLPELTPTCMTLNLRYCSITKPIGCTDVDVKVGKFQFPADFVVVDFDADPRVPLILGRSFFKGPTFFALIDCVRRELTLRVGKKRNIQS
ncbi:reverse transcriptase domain-containing protein [Tanacetum coccineum]